MLAPPLYADLIDRIYAAAVDSSLWSGLGRDIARVFDTHSVALQVRDAASGAIEILARPESTTEATDKAYTSYYHKHDIWASAAATQRMMDATRGEAIISDSDFAETEIYRDFFRQFGIFNVIGALIPASLEQIGLIGIHRARWTKPFEAAHERTLSELLPHLQRALQIRARLSVKADASPTLATFDEHKLSVMIVDHTSRLLYANKNAERLLNAGDAMSVRDGALTATHVRSGLRLQRLLREVTGHATAPRGKAPGGLLSIPRPGRFPLAVLVAPHRITINPATAAAPVGIVMIRDPEHHADLNAALQSLFGLTPAEAKIANALAAGAALDEIAAKHGLSLHTVRSQLKSIAAKTGTSRQGELIALIHKATSFPSL